MWSIHISKEENRDITNFAKLHERFRLFLESQSFLFSFFFLLRLLHGFSESLRFFSGDSGPARGKEKEQGNRFLGLVRAESAAGRVRVRAKINDRSVGQGI